MLVHLRHLDWTDTTLHKANTVPTGMRCTFWCSSKKRWLLIYRQLEAKHFTSKIKKKKRLWQFSTSSVTTDELSSGASCFLKYWVQSCIFHVNKKSSMLRQQQKIFQGQDKFSYEIHRQMPIVATLKWGRFSCGRKPQKKKDNKKKLLSCSCKIGGWNNLVNGTSLQAPTG